MVSINSSLATSRSIKLSTISLQIQLTLCWVYLLLVYLHVIYINVMFSASLFGFIYAWELHIISFGNSYLPPDFFLLYVSLCGCFLVTLSVNFVTLAQQVVFPNWQLAYFELCEDLPCLLVFLSRILVPV